KTCTCPLRACWRSRRAMGRRYCGSEKRYRCSGSSPSRASFSRAAWSAARSCWSMSRVSYFATSCQAPAELGRGRVGGERTVWLGAKRSWRRRRRGSQPRRGGPSRLVSQSLFDKRACFRQLGPRVVALSGELDQLRVTLTRFVLAARAHRCPGCPCERSEASGRANERLIIVRESRSWLTELHQHLGIELARRRGGPRRHRMLFGRVLGVRRLLHQGLGAFPVALRQRNPRARHARLVLDLGGPIGVFGRDEHGMDFLQLGHILAGARRLAASRRAPNPRRPDVPPAPP